MSDSSNIFWVAGAGGSGVAVGAKVSSRSSRSKIKDVLHGGREGWRWGRGLGVTPESDLGMYNSPP